MKKNFSILLSICLILEIILSSAAFAEGQCLTEKKPYENVTEKITEEKSEIKEAIAYLSGVFGCATAMLFWAYHNVFKSAQPQSQQTTPQPPVQPAQPPIAQPVVLPSATTTHTETESKKPNDVSLICLTQAKPYERLKAIHWQNNLCWFNSTILMFYYHKEFHDFIASFPIDEAIVLLREDIDFRAKNKLRAFIELTKTFREIDHCDRIYRFPNRNLYDSLDAEIDFHTHEKEDKQKLKYGETGIPFQIDLYNMITDVSVFADNFTDNHKEKFPEIKAWLSHMTSNVNPRKREKSNWSLNELFKQAGITQRFEKNHYWINITHEKSTYAIGKSIHDLYAIALVN